MKKPPKRNPYARELEEEKYRQRIRPGKVKKWRRPKYRKRDFEYEDDEPEAD